MKIKVKGKKPKPVPEPTYSITGLSLDEMRFLRDLTGRFADNPGDGGIKNHIHTRLYCQIAAALPDDRIMYKKAFGFTAHNGVPAVLHCKRL